MFLDELLYCTAETASDVLAIHVQRMQTPLRGEMLRQGPGKAESTTNQLHFLLHPIVRERDDVPNAYTNIV